MGVPIPQRDPKPGVTETERRAHVPSGRGTQENSVCLGGWVHTFPVKEHPAVGRGGFHPGQTAGKAVPWHVLRNKKGLKAAPGHDLEGPLLS